MIVHYRWHPLYGRCVSLRRTEQRVSGRFVQIEAEPGVVLVVAAWMLDPVPCAEMIARGLEPPAYGPRRVGCPGKLAPYLDYLGERITAFPDLSAVRLTREIRERGYEGAYTAVKRFLCAARPADRPKPFEARFETPAGQRAQVDFARFVTVFTDQPEITRIIWLFSLVLGHSRSIFARFVLHQDLQTLLRCHMLAFESIGGVPLEILYDRMKTAVTGEDGEGHIIYNRALLTMAQHYRFLPKACRPYRAKTKEQASRCTLLEWLSDN